MLGLVAKLALPYAIDFGSKWLQGREMKKDQKKAEEEHSRAQAMSKLISAIGSAQLRYGRR